MRANDWLQRAREHCFIAGVGDLGAELCAANSAFGLAKVHHVQRQLGLKDDAYFIGSPDATATRNSRRWQQGFGYGGLLALDPQIAVLDAKPNGCGMLVGVLADIPNADEVKRRAREAERCPPTLDGVAIEYDLAESNHFVDACTLEQVLVPDPPPLPSELFIIHSSGHEHRASSPWGPGLYWDESRELRESATRYQTPWGQLLVLGGDAAQAYYRFCRRVQEFNCRRRELFGRLLFGEFDVLRNATHQGFRAPGLFYLGCNFFESGESGLYPLTLGPDQPVYMIRPKQSFSLDAIERLGWHDRAQRLGLMDALQSANMLPHGGGYAFDGSLQGVSGEGDDARRYHVRRADGTKQSFVDIRQLPFAYRDDVVLRRLVELGLGEPVARYRIRFIIK